MSGKHTTRSPRSLRTAHLAAALVCANASSGCGDSDDPGDTAPDSGSELFTLYASSRI